MNFDPMKIFFFILRVVPVIILIVIVANVFFSFKVEVKSDEMERLSIELSENVMSSGLVYDKSVFDIRKLLELEKSINEIDKEYRNIEMPFKTCSFGYYIHIEGSEQMCGFDEECKRFCMDVCGIPEEQINNGDNCKCSTGFLGIKKLFGDADCQCKRNDKWADRYEFSYGYAPDDPIEEYQKEYPVGLAKLHDTRPEDFYESVYPATLTISIYDSFLGKISCAIDRAYALKEKQEIMVIGFGDDCAGDSDIRCAAVKKSGDYQNSNHICTFDISDGEFKTTECRYSKTPVLTFLEEYWDDSKIAKLKAYPIKKDSLAQLSNTDGTITHTDICRASKSNCDIIKNNPDYIATQNDEVGVVVLCLEAQKEDKLC